MKKTTLFLVLLALFGVWEGVVAQEDNREAYAVLDADGLLKFYYDTNKPDESESVTVYDIPWNTGDPDDWNEPVWVNYEDYDENGVLIGNTDIKSVAFDASFSNYSLESAYGMFSTCTALTSIDFTNFNTSNVRNMAYMFYNCSALTGIDLSTFDTKNVLFMYDMFDGCSSLTELNLTNFITENVEDMCYMFYECESLQTLNLSNFNTENVYDMCDMFYGCSGLTNLDLSSFDTSNVGDMSGMFAGCENLQTLDVSNFITANVWNMSGMFADCSSLQTLDVSNFSTANVEYMSYMFAGCENLQTLDVSNFITVNVEDMSNMFAWCESLQTLNVSNFNTANVENMSGMFYGCSNLTTIYCNDDWESNSVNLEYSEEMFEGCEQLVGAIQYSDYNANDVTFANPDDGYFTASGPRAYAVLTNGKLTFYYDELKSTRNGVKYSVPWNSGNQNDWRDPAWVEWDNDGNTSITSVAFDASFSDYELVSAYDMFATCTALKSIDFTNFNTSAVTNMNSMFYWCENLKSLNLKSFNTTNVVDMADMFCGCYNLTTIYCNDDWYRENLNSDRMFYECSNLEGAVSYSGNNTNDATLANPTNGYFTATGVRPYAVLTDDGKLTFYYDEYSADKSFDPHTSDIYYNFQWGYNDPEWSNNGNILTVTFDASFSEYPITATNVMFCNLYNLTTVNGLENLNTSNVVDMSLMFSLCSSLKSLDLTSFNTANVQNMSNMFAYCSSLKTLDLSSFNTAQVTDMHFMFYECQSLITIYCDDDWSNKNVTIENSAYMFYECFELRGAISHSSNEDYDHRDDITYANPTTGYFTKREAYATVSNGNLTFYYDENKPSSGAYEFTATGEGSWRNASFTAVTFDASMKTFRFTSTASMFRGKTSLTVINDLSNLNTSKVTDMSNMFNGCSSLTAIYCNYDWSGLNVTSDNMFAGCTSLQGYNASNVSAAYAKSIENGGYFTTYGIPYAVYYDGTLTFYNDGDKDNRQGVVYDLPWEGEFPEWKPEEMAPMAPNRRAKADYVYITSVVFDESFSNYHGLTSTKNMFAELGGVTTITGLEYLNTENVTNMSYMFSGCSNLTNLDLSNLDTGNVTDMSSMFSNCSALTSLDLSNFNTEKVTNMTYMFFACYYLESLNLSSFDTGEVTDLSTMFHSCNRLTGLDLSGFDTGKVTTMETMFYDCNALTNLNLSNFDTGNVTDMSSMFYGCEVLRSLDLSNFDTGKVTTMFSMFKNCSQLESLNLSGWSNTNVTRMDEMFYGCSALTDLNLTNFRTVNVTDMSQMFQYCSALTSLDLTGFELPTGNTIYLSYMFSGCTNLGTIFCNKDFNNGYVYRTTGESMFNACVNLQGAIHHSTYETDYTYANPSTGYFTYGLRDYADNSSIIANTSTMPRVGLVGRTLNTTGVWNTLCLPFSLTSEQIASSPLAGAEIRTLSNSAFANDVLTLNFTPETGEGAITEITAGTPYIIRWLNSDGNVIEAPIFTNVTVNNGNSTVVSTDKVDFVGSYDPVQISGMDNTVLYLGANNTLYYPSRAMTIGSCRAYFQLKLSSDEASQIRAINLGFDEEENGISEIKAETENADWYTLDGRKLMEKPVEKGIYINGGRKVMIK